MKCEFWQLPGNAVYKSMCCQATKRKSDDVVKWSGGQNSAEERSTWVLVAATPTHVLTEPLDKPAAGEKLDPAHPVQHLLEGGLWPGELKREQILQRKSKTLSLVPEKVTSPEDVTWANSICWPASSSPEAGLLVPMYKMNQTFSDHPGRRSTVVSALRSFVSSSPI